MTTWIAEHPVIFVHPDGTRRAGRIAIGLPVAREVDYACAVCLEGLANDIAIAGTGTLQALLLAARFLGFRLHDFIAKGGRVQYPEPPHDDIPLRALFGPLLREPIAPADD